MIAQPNARILHQGIQIGRTQLGTVDTVMLVGVLIGLNYAGLFVGAYLVEKRQKYLFHYMAASVLLMVSGGFNAWGSAGGPALAFTIRHMLDLAAFAIFSMGLFHSTGKALPRGVLPLLLTAGFIALIATHGLPSHDVTRSSAVSGAKFVFVASILFQVFSNRRTQAVYRILMSALAVMALQYLAHPVVAYSFTLPGAADNVGTAYNEADSILTLMGLFTVSAALVLQTTYEIVGRHKRMSETDYLTGLLNRRGVFEKASKVDAVLAAVIVVDIDRFKSVNDRFGHDIGDQVIARVGSILGSASKLGAICGRMGGEEFAIVLGRASVETARLLAESMRVAIETKGGEGLDADLKITASFGVSMIRAGEFQSALVRADEALYRAKSSGRNCVMVSGLTVSPREETTDASVRMQHVVARIATG